MPPKFHKSRHYLECTESIEEEVLEEYTKFLDSFQAEDVLLKHVPILLKKLKVPQCYTNDISDCIQWFYDTQDGRLSRSSAQWVVVTQLLQHITMTVTSNGELDVSDIVDVDKLVRFCVRLIKFRNSHSFILDSWSLFTEAAGYSDSDITKLRLSLQDLKMIKSKLQLDDLSDSILIDMLGCSGSTVDGDLYNYRMSKVDLLVGIKDFGEVLGQLGELN